jgi:hypothetical protein
MYEQLDLVLDQDAIENLTDLHTIRVLLTTADQNPHVKPSPISAPNAIRCAGSP